MKKSTLSTIYSALKGIDFDSEILAEIEKELNRGAAQAQAKAAEYDAAWDIVKGAFALTEKPITVAEILDEVGDALPQGFTRGKLTYALTHYWADRVVKVEGKVNAYTLA